MFQWVRTLPARGMTAALAVAILAGCAASAAPTPAAGPLAALPDGFPNQPIVVFTGGAGSGVDLFARALNKATQPFSPVPLIVENTSGAAITVRWAEMAMAKPGGPEGYWLWTQTFSTTARSFQSPPGKATWQDVGEPVAVVLDQDAFFVRGETPWKNLSDFVKYAKENPGGVLIGGTAPGGSDHITAETFAKVAGFQYTYVPHESSAAAVITLIGSGVDAMFGPPGANLAQVKAGTLRVLGIPGGQRSPVLPDVPTFKEQGYDFGIEQLRAFWALASVPKAHLEWLQELYRRGAQTEEFQKYLEGSGERSQHERLDEFSRGFKEQVKVIEQGIRALGLHYEQQPR